MGFSPATIRDHLLRGEGARDQPFNLLTQDHLGRICNQPIHQVDGVYAMELDEVMILRVHGDPAMTRDAH